MRPDLAGPRHQVIAARAAGLRRRHRRHALLPPALGETEGTDQAEGDVAIRAAIKHGLHEFGVIDIVHSAGYAPTPAPLSRHILAIVFPREEARPRQGPATLRWRRPARRSGWPGKYLARRTSAPRSATRSADLRQSHKAPRRQAGA